MCFQPERTAGKKRRRFFHFPTRAGRQTAVGCISNQRNTYCKPAQAVFGNSASLLKNQLEPVENQLEPVENQRKPVPNPV